MNTVRDHEGAAERGGPPASFFALAGVIVLVWVVFQLGWMTGHVFSATKFILGDQGSYLYAVDCWRAGEALYRDFAWQYGPLALGWYRAFAAIGGNTPLTLVVASSAAFAAGWVLVARLVVRLAGRVWGGGLALLALLPVMSASGPGSLNGAHGALEMLLLAGCAWLLAGRKSAWRPWQLGVLAGLMHWVRFGPQVAALAGIMIITAWRCGQEAADRPAFVRQMAAFAGRLLAGYALTVAPLVIWFLVALPWPNARDQLWPAHMVAHYAQTYPNRWPQIASAREFAMIWLPAVAGVGLVLHRLLAGWKHCATGVKEIPDGTAAGLMFLPLYYLLCCAVLFHNDNPIIGHLWLAWPGLALATGLTSKGWRAVLLLLIVPAVGGISARNWGLREEEQSWQARPLTLPNGQQLWFHAGEAGRFRALHAALAAEPPARRLAVFLSGGGIHHFFGTERMGRHWWFLPEFVRPYEEPAVLAALLRSERILVADRGQAAESLQGAPGPVVLWLPLSRPMAQQLQPHLSNHRHLEGIGELLDVRP